MIGRGMGTKAGLELHWYYKINDYRVDSSLLGYKIELSTSPWRVIVVLPSDNDDWAVPKPELQPLKQGQSSGTWIISLVQVRVSSPGDQLRPLVGLTREQMLAGEQLPDARAKPLMEAYMAGREGFANFVDHLRTVCGQYWIRPTQKMPEAATAPTLVDLDRGTHELLAFIGAFIVPYNLLRNMVDSAESIRALRWSLSRGDPDLAFSLLSDAYFLAFETGGANDRQAVLTAAIACEVMIKQTLREIATTGQQELVDTLINNPRDYSMAAASLFSNGLRAVCGRDLKSENRELWKSIDFLFKERNRIAHREGSVPSGDVAKCVQTAGQTFKWLQGIRAAHSHASPEGL